MHKQKAPIYRLPQSKAPKHSKFRLRDIQEKPVIFLWYRILLTWFLTKVSVPVESIIPRLVTGRKI